MVRLCLAILYNYYQSGIVAIFEFKRILLKISSVCDVLFYTGVF